MHLKEKMDTFREAFRYLYCRKEGRGGREGGEERGQEVEYFCSGESVDGLCSLKRVKFRPGFKWCERNVTKRILYDPHVTSFHV